MAAPTFSAGGLSSGMDWNGIIDSLVSLERRPITLLQQRQSAVKSQLSALGVLASRLSALETAVEGLGKSGALALKVASAPASVAAVAGTRAVAGRYEVRVESLASGAKSRSAGFAAGETVRGGTLGLTVMGKPYTVAIADGASLDEVAYALDHAGAPITATVLDDGTTRYLSVTPLEAGYPVGGAPTDALSIVETSTGIRGQPLGLSLFRTAANAVVHVDGLRFERSSNEVAGAVPGTTLSLKATSTAAEDLVVAHDLDATAARLQAFVDAYNGAIGFVQQQLNVTEASDRASTLAGDAAVRGLQAALQRTVSAATGPGADVRSLADVGVKSERNGSLSLDRETLAAAIARDPVAVDELFTAKETGLAALVSDLVDRQTDSVDGILSGRQKSLDGQLDRMADDALRLEARLDAYRSRLIQQFTAMENVVGGLRSIGNYLTQVSNQGTGDKS